MKIYRENENAQIPEFATEGSACFDLRACLDGVEKVVTYNPHNKKIEVPVRVNNDTAQFQIPPMYRCLIPTGLIFDIPKNCVMKVYARSSFALKYGLNLANSVAVIDSDYVDQTYVMLNNMTDTPVTIKSGERVAQAMLEKTFSYELSETKRKPKQKTDRDGGLGSTGKE